MVVPPAAYNVADSVFLGISRAMALMSGLLRHPRLRSELATDTTYCLTQFRARRRHAFPRHVDKIATDDA